MLGLPPPPPPHRLPASRRGEPAQHPDAFVCTGAARGVTLRGDPAVDRGVSTSTRSSRRRSMIILAAARATASFSAEPPAAHAQSAFAAAAAGRAGPDDTYDAWLITAAASRRGDLEQPAIAARRGESLVLHLACPCAADEGRIVLAPSGTWPVGLPCDDGGGDQVRRPRCPPTEHSAAHDGRTVLRVGLCMTLGFCKRDAACDADAQRGFYPLGVLAAAHGRRYHCLGLASWCGHGIFAARCVGHHRILTGALRPLPTPPHPVDGSAAHRRKDRARIVEEHLFIVDHVTLPGTTPPRPDPPGEDHECDRRRGHKRLADESTPRAHGSPRRGRQQRGGDIWGDAQPRPALTNRVSVCRRDPRLDICNRSNELGDSPTCTMGPRGSGARKRPFRSPAVSASAIAQPAKLRRHSGPPHSSAMVVTRRLSRRPRLVPTAMAAFSHLVTDPPLAVPTWPTTRLGGLSTRWAAAARA